MDKAVGGPSFSSVRKARAALKENAFESYQLLLYIIKQATAAGDFETAARYAWMILEHTPEDEGERVLDISVDKPKQVESGPKGPSVYIGLIQGGVTQPKKELPQAAEVTIIDVEPE